MKFTKVRTIGRTTTDFPIIGANVSDTYIVKEIDGLGPPVVDVSISNTLYQGGIFRGRRPQNREIVFKIAFNPNYSSGQKVSDLRSALYGLLTPNRENQIEVQLMEEDSVVAVTRGFVKSMDPVIFSKEPAVQIVVACIDAYLEAPSAVNLNVSTLNRTTLVLQNDGTATTGFRMELKFTSTTNQWSLTDSDSGDTMHVNEVFNANDSLVINTIPGSRAIERWRSGVMTNIVGSLTADSDWLDLFLGLNLFHTSSPNFNWVSFSFTPQYWGV